MCDVESQINDNTARNSSNDTKLLTEKCLNPEENVENHEDKLEIDNLQEKYGDLISVVNNAEKENKSAKKKKRNKKKRKISDPVVRNIAELMSNSLKIISPDKPYKGSDLEDTPAADEMEPSEENGESNKTECELNQEGTVNGNGDFKPVESEDSQDTVERSTTLSVDSEESQDALEKKKDLKKKKHSRLSTNKSPKGKKFKDCSQQSKLNGFFQIKSPPDKDKEKERVEKVFEEDRVKDTCSRLKLSNSLFKSPRSSKIREANKKCEGKEDKQILIPEEKSINSNSDEVTEIKSPPVKKRGRPRKNANEVVLTPKSKESTVSVLKSQGEENSTEEVISTPKSKKSNLRILKSEEEEKSNKEAILKPKSKKSTVSILKCKEESNSNKEKEVISTPKSNKSTVSILKCKEENNSNKEKKVISTPKSKKSTVSILKCKEENLSKDVISTPKSKISTINNLESKEEDVISSPKNVNNEKLIEESPSDKKVTPTRKDNSSETQTTPQRNAFQFMMDQRNKVIGSNSPGKAPPESPVEDTQEVEAKKERLSKRKKQFSEWSESKGRIKRKLEEEERQEYADKVLESRAKLMKEMLTGEIVENGVQKSTVEGMPSENVENDSEDKSLKKNGNDGEEKAIQKNVNKQNSVEENESEEKSVRENGKKRKSVQVNASEKQSSLKKRKRKRVVRIESTSESSNDSTFMQSLSKRKKLEVDDNETPKNGLLKFFDVTAKNNSNNGDIIEEINEVEIIKPKRTRKKKNSLSVKKIKPDIFTDDELNKALTTEEEHSRSSDTSNTSSVMSFSSMKKKLLIKLKNPLFKDNIKEDNEDESEVNVVETDDEIRRSVRKKAACSYAEEDLDLGKVKSKSKKEDKEKKVAPVFLKSAPKPKEDPAVVQARMEFLRSGVPSTLKKIAEKQQSIEEIDFNSFPLISHIQQKTSDSSSFWNLTSAHLDLKEPENKIHLNNLLKKGEVTNSDSDLPARIDLKEITNNLRFKSIIEEIKTENSDYPVYKTFRLLSEKAGRSFEKLESPSKTPSPVKRKRGRPKKKPVAEEDDVLIIENEVNKDVNPAVYAMWTEKYKPRSSQEIIGNYKSVMELRDWLNGWIEYSKEVRAGKKRRRCESSDFESTDGESRDSVKLPCNTMVLKGPLGSGKSVAVYAICQELAVNVLEVNASSKRTGKKLLQDMQEATQSHQVSKKEINSLTAFLHKDKIPKEIQEAKSKSENKMCVLLIEDADIVFDQDEGFIYALSQLILTSKRPVILLTSNVDCNHMQKFTSQYPVLSFDELTANHLSVWLQIVCLLEGLYVDRNAIGELLEWNKGDVRRTLLELQFWVQSGGVSINNVESTSNNNLSLFKKYSQDAFDGFIYEDDKNSILNNFTDLESTEVPVLQKNCIKSFLVNNPIPFPVNLGLVWWNLPDLLDLNRERKIVEKKKEINEFLPDLLDLNREKMIIEKKEEINELKKVSEVYDALAFGDVLYRTEGFDVESEPCCRRWEEGLKEGLNLKEDTVDFKSNRSLSREIAHFLIDGRCRVFNPSFEGGINMAVPVSSERRWRNKQHECEQEFLNAISPSYAVHRSAFAVDYFPALRTISRTEFERAQSSNKRGNRFYNYLKTLNVNTNNSTLKTACNTMTSTCRK